MNELLHDMAHLKKHKAYAPPNKFIIHRLLKVWEKTKNEKFRQFWYKVNDRDLMQAYLQENATREQIEALTDAIIGTIGIPIYKVNIMFNKITNHVYDNS